MSNWGILKGLGEGMQQLGGSIFKAKVLDKLKEEEQVRAEDRQTRREEAKRASTVAQVRYIERDGVWMEQKLNSNYNVIEETLAPKSEVDRLNRERQKDQVSLDNLVSQTELNKKKVANYDEDRAMGKEEHQLDLELKRSGIAENLAQADSARRRGTSDWVGGSGSSGGSAGTTDDPTPGKLAQILVKENSALEKELTEGDTPQMSKGEFRQIALSVIQNTSAGHDPRANFLKALRLYKSPAKANQPTIPTKSKFKR